MRYEKLEIRNKSKAIHSRLNRLSGFRQTLKTRRKYIMRIMLEFGVCRILHINGDSEAERDFLAEFTGDMRVQRTEEGLAV